LGFGPRGRLGSAGAQQAASRRPWRLEGRTVACCVSWSTRRAPVELSGGGRQAHSKSSALHNAFTREDEALLVSLTDVRPRALLVARVRA
jgi:hypothetical protein